MFTIIKKKRNFFAPLDVNCHCALKSKMSVGVGV
jgi:hypothetical protein